MPRIGHSANCPDSAPGQGGDTGVTGNIGTVGTARVDMAGDRFCARDGAREAHTVAPHVHDRAARECGMKPAEIYVAKHRVLARLRKIADEIRAAWEA